MFSNTERRVRESKGRHESEETIRRRLNLVLGAGMGFFILVTIAVEVFGWEPGLPGKSVLLVVAVGWLLGFCGFLGWAGLKKSGKI